MLRRQVVGDGKWDKIQMRSGEVPKFTCKTHGNKPRTSKWFLCLIKIMYKYFPPVGCEKRWLMNYARWVCRVVGVIKWMSVMILIIHHWGLCRKPSTIQGNTWDNYHALVGTFIIITRHLVSQFIIKFKFVFIFKKHDLERKNNCFVTLE